MTELSSSVIDGNGRGLSPKSLDLFKDDLHGGLSWLRDNDYVTRGYRSNLTFIDVLARYVSCTSPI